jgi:peptidoglycan/xylan/chitin deacetylase (PgdA/CDA1 family)
MAHYVFDDQRRAFERQIDMLRDKGNFVATNEALEMLRGEVPVDGSYFHLSFDDGLDCIARNAAPVLDAAGVPVLVFVNSALAGTPFPEERVAWELATNYAAPLKVMNWETLVRTGFEVGAHTRTHVRLADISNDQQRLEREIIDCKIEVETKLGRPCQYFAWPFGRLSDVDEESFAVIRTAGFEAVFGGFRAPVEPGLTNPLMIPRHHFEPQWPLAHLRFFALGGGASPVEGQI